MADATYIRNRDDNRITAAAAIAAGEVWQLADGRAAVLTGLAAAASGDRVNFTTTGQFTFTKTASQVWVDGQPIYWDHSANSATCLTPTSDRDFLLGSALGDAASADTTGAVNLNVTPVYVASLKPVGLASTSWVTEATDGLGTTPLVGGGIQMAFDAVVEAAQAANYTERTFTLASNWIVEGRCAVYDIGDNAALDIDIGVASASHATDFESVAEFVALHLNGNALDIYAHSDDGTTDVAPTDTTVNAVDDTYFDFVIDGRNPSDVQIYVNGVLVLGSTVFTLGAATGPLKLIAHMEKTSDDTTADFRVDFLRVRTAEQ